MKKLFAATFIGVVLLLIFSFGCSSTPSGTVSVEELQKDPASRLGQDVVVVGDTEIKTDLSSFKMFKLTKNYKYIWVSIPEGTDEPPQATKVRVTGKLQQKDMSIVGKIYYIEANQIRME